MNSITKNTTEAQLTVVFFHIYDNCVLHILRI